MGIIEYWGLYSGPSISGNYQMGLGGSSCAGKAEVETR